MSSSPQPGYSGMHVKGGLLRARFLFVVLNHGVDTWARVLAALPKEERESLNEIVLDDWYPLATLDLVDRAIAEELGDGDNEDEVFDRLGEFSATSSLSGPYSSLINPDVHSFLTQSALIHHAYQDFGKPSYAPLSETSGLLTIQYDKAPPVSFCVSGSSYFRHAVELCGARSARVTHTRCRARGDDACEFYFTWQP
ncbi:MAG TPA: hypothetical protein VLM38_18490 [Blastocatellia bacterium]|nr:hypothetical protein [Blastocatellia bacterium]